MALPISCDEAGHTGPDLLEPNQRYFAYASVCLEDDEAKEVIHLARAKHPVRMPELKASRLMRTARGRALIAEVIEKVRDKFAINVYDKLVALCGWIFEYIYEPVYQHNPTILYQKSLHKFVAMFCWLWFQENSSDVREAVHQFQRYMRSRNTNDAPLFFDRTWEPITGEGPVHPFECVLRFAAGYKDIIHSDNRNLNRAMLDGGRWVLDLSASALWSHLNYWGQHGCALRVQCDVSKPLQAIVPRFTGDETDPGIRRARRIGRADRLGWQLEHPIQFVDSSNHAAVQLADIIGGAAVRVFSNAIPDDADDVESELRAGLMQESILPDLGTLDLNQRTPMVNYLVLYDLALRAGQRAHPYAGLVELYQEAENSWDRGEHPKILPGSPGHE